MGEFFVIIIIAFIGYQIMNYIVSIPGIMLKNKFNGDMTGMTLEEISEVCGKPNSIHYGYGYILCQWQATGYHIALEFNNDKKFVTIFSVSSSI
jgi:hypothetical protein